MTAPCEHTTGLDDTLYWRNFSKTLMDRRVPFAGSAALTYRCNLRCVHCYVAGGAEAGLPAEELDSAQWRRLIAEIKEAGCLYLLLTGGEPLLHPDFPEIYSFAKRSGFLVTVFTNGVLIDDRIVELFGELPPRLVEITLYGAAAGTHDRVTGAPGSFARAIEGIEKLIGRGVPVGLKSILMTVNQDEFPAMGSLAKRYGVRFRTDAAIFPTLSGNRAPLDLRVAPERAVAMEMADAERLGKWKEFYENFRIGEQGKRIFVCGAGQTTFHIDPDGRLFPCLMVRSLDYSLEKGNFAEGWEEMARLRRWEASDDFACNRCEKKSICGFCPAFFELENGSPQIPSEYICETGRRRHEYIMNYGSGG